MLTVNEVAEHLRLGPDEVRVMIRQGKLPAVKIGSRWRVRRETVQALMRRTSPPSRSTAAKALRWRRLASLPLRTEARR